MAAVADTLPFDHNYTSGVVAWKLEDQPTDEQIAAVDGFEKAAWAGLEFDRNSMNGGAAPRARRRRSRPPARWPLRVRARTVVSRDRVE